MYPSPFSLQGNIVYQVNVPTLTTTQLSALSSQVQGMLLNELDIISYNISGEVIYGSNLLNFMEVPLDQIYTKVNEIKTELAMQGANMNAYAFANLGRFVSEITDEIIDALNLTNIETANRVTFEANLQTYLLNNITILSNPNADYNPLSLEIMDMIVEDLELDVISVIESNIPQDLALTVAALPLALSNITQEVALGDMDIEEEMFKAFAPVIHPPVLLAYSPSEDAYSDLNEQISTFISGITPETLGNPIALLAQLNSLLENIASTVSQVTSEIYSKIEANLVELSQSISEQINTNIDNYISSTVNTFVTNLDTLISNEYGVNIDDTVTLEAQLNALIGSQITDSSITFGLNVTSEEFANTYLSDLGYLGDISTPELRATLAQNLLADLSIRAGMDADFDDIATLTYYLDSDILPVVKATSEDGEVVYITNSKIYVNEDGSYEIYGGDINALDSSYTLEVSFSYYVQDSSGAISESSAVVINVDIPDNSTYFNTVLSSETIDGERTLEINSNVLVNPISFGSLNLFVDGATADSTLEFAGRTLTAQATTKPDNVEITYDGFMITSGDVDTSFVAPSLAVIQTFYAFGFENDRGDYYIEKLKFKNNILFQNIHELNSLDIDSEDLPLSDIDNDGNLEVLGSWGTDELEFGEAKQVTNINGIDVSAYGLYQVAVTFNTFAAPEIEDITDWWDASWMGASTLVELGQKLVDPTDDTSVYTEENSYKLNLRGKTVYNTETNEISGTWENKIINGVSYLVVNIDGDYSRIYTQTENGIEMTERGIPGITSEQGILYYGDNVNVDSIKALLTQVVANESFEIPEYLEDAPTDYYFTIDGYRELSEVLNTEITITNVEEQVNVIAELDTYNPLNNEELNLKSLAGDNVQNGTENDDIITLNDNTISYIDAQEGEDTLDLSSEDSNLDLASLLSNISIYNIENIDMTSDSVHILSNFTLDEFVSLTDEDNTLKVLGDGADTISLDSTQNWKQMMGTDGTTPYTDADGFHVYTTTNASSQTLKLLIEDTITVENV